MNSPVERFARAQDMKASLIVPWNSFMGPSDPRTGTTDPIDCYQDFLN